ncbi:MULTISPECIES: hypothetical protein [Kandleria]|jgi:hypothetical protein|uniref:Uncharacterized protein n=1 Tax=Kandleria vitulina DSM 20405 TaxID=1410657 RepID=A0A0R2HDJ1_9FIRM|nr:MULTISPECIES: hypothetical protein [Kandleria]KRN50523.1 hypothetical protein IV49_GL002017 [Kandleria vitulina DSM 20405]MBP3276660.1 hypothetical protein [Kandleria sp.]MEE0988270.1 hypothetical protein [Kandleria vitulina]SEI59825.1 hypothetical protein SAMN05216514_101211 [Kandleria vitulina]
MNNVYVEYNYERDVPMTSRLIFSGLVAIAAVLSFYSLFVPIFIPVALLFIILGYYYHKSFNSEYEYILLDDDLAIDRILNLSKRKKVARYDLSTLIDCEKENPHFYKKYEHISYKIKTYQSKKNTDPIYLFMLEKGNMHTCLRMHCNQELIEALQKRHNRVMKV